MVSFRCAARRSATCSTLPSTAVRCFSHAVAVPELQVVVVARDDDLALEPGVPDERRRHEHPARAVDVRVARAREEEAPELARLARERVEHGHAGLDGHLPRLPWVDRDVPVDPAREHDPAAEHLAKARRESESALLVDRVLVGADEHRLGPWPIVVAIPTLPHFMPLDPTWQVSFDHARRDTYTCSMVRRRRAGQRTATCRGATPLPVSAPAPQRAAKAIASSPVRPEPSAYVSPAAKLSPAP